MLNRLRHQCTPLDWALEATARAAKLTGTEEGRQALVEANRYRAWAQERELWEREVERLRGDFR